MFRTSNLFVRWCHHDSKFSDKWKEITLNHEHFGSFADALDISACIKIAFQFPVEPPSVNKQQGNVKSVSEST
ncbi:hypothetical protein MUK42_36573 [Musa troglodytarum]|uniref:Uncharacterized protein n=1 Tax=Musa troglodytarum TaxID=320322 RepID=A0A9E7JA20_9LILI|nr:hypothetical protein MUK42_36573 [Musa troglodytarum]